MTAAGDLLIRTTSRTVVYQGGAFKDYLPQAPLPDGDIESVFQTANKEILVGSDDFLYLARAHEIRTLRQGTNFITSFLQGDDGQVWVGGAKGLYVYRNGTLSVTPYALGQVGVYALDEDRMHRIWVGTHDGLYRLGLDGRSIEPIAQGLIHGIVTALLEDRDGNRWVGAGDSGLFRLNGEGKSEIAQAGVLNDSRVLSLLEDREGSLWVGTSNGLERFRDANLTTISEREGLPSGKVQSIVAGQDGSLYAFCEGGGLARIRDGVVTVLSKKQDAANYYGHTLFESRDGSLWVRTQTGLEQYKNGKFTLRPLTGELKNRFIAAISEDGEGMLVASSETLILRYKDGKVRPFTINGRTTPLSKPGNYTFAIYRDAAGTLWFGTVKGLFKFAKGQSPDRSRQPAVDFPVTSISHDDRGNLWLGGRTPGIAELRADGKVIHFTKKDGLFDEYSTSALADREGNLWISTSNGIYCANGKDLDAFADGRVAKVRTTLYAIADGMITRQATPPSDGPAALRTADGRLWFTTTKGIVVIDPEHLKVNRLIPPVVIESAVVDGHVYSARQNLNLPPHKDTIEFHYTALSLLIPERVRFKYRLEGYDRDWVDAADRRVAYYTNLRPGRYRFHVMAANNDGVWNENGATVSLYLAPAFYQSRWFYFLCGLLLLGLIKAVIQFNTRRLRARAATLKQLVEERTKTLQLEIVERQHAEQTAIHAREEMRYQATHDALTSLLNRRAILEVLSHELADLNSEPVCLVVLMADIDHFKSINDRFGHLTGDEVLREVTRRMVAAVRSCDYVGRYGGEEFIIVLKNCEPGKAMARAEELRMAIAAVPVETAQGLLPVTLSMGVYASVQHAPAASDDVLLEIDAALYAAKDAGRNRCQMAAVCSDNMMISK
jgi:diguanylate cyclase (GGDEF)-like protein